MTPRQSSTIVAVAVLAYAYTVGHLPDPWPRVTFRFTFVAVAVALVLRWVLKGSPDGDMQADLPDDYPLSHVEPWWPDTEDAA